MTLSSTLRSTRGFTLIELLVVIVIIGILATGAISVFQGAQAKARDSQRISDLETLKTALEQYFNDNDKYPADGALANFQTLLKPYVNKWPKDPVNTSGTGYQYVYCVADVNGVAKQTYALIVRVEKPESARKSTLAQLVPAFAADTDAKSTYVTGSEPSLVSAAAKTSAIPTCAASVGTTITNGIGGVIL